MFGQQHTSSRYPFILIILMNYDQLSIDSSHILRFIFLVMIELEVGKHCIMGN